MTGEISTTSMGKQVFKKEDRLQVFSEMLTTALGYGFEVICLTFCFVGGEG